jgi:hypothetical protein
VPEAIGRGGVNQVDARINGRADRPNRLIIIRCAPPGAAAHGPGSQGHHGGGYIGISQLSVLHFTISLFIFSIFRTLFDISQLKNIYWLFFVYETYYEYDVLNCSHSIKIGKCKVPVNRRGKGQTARTGL